MNNPFAPGLLSRLERRPREAVLRASRIGDFLCATPTLRALRRALPDAGITMITLPMLRELAVRSPHPDRYLAFPGFPGLAEQFFDVRRTVRFFQEMQAEQFDILAHDCVCRGANVGTCRLGAPCLDAVTVQEVVAAAEAVAGQT